MFLSKGITKRWLLHYFSVTVALMVLMIFGASFAVRSYYYEEIKLDLEECGSEITRYLSPEELSEKEHAAEVLKKFAENFEKNDSVKLTAADQSGEIIFDSTGLVSEKSQGQLLFEQAASSENGTLLKTDTLTTGEKIMSLTVLINDESGKNSAAVKFVSSLDETDGKILFAILIIIAAAVLLLASFIIPGLAFIGTIVKPVRELCATSRRIAQGDFETRVEKMYDDEIGELADSINYMAEEIKASDGMKNDFISSVSHELRTPLTAIKGWAETMSIGEPDPATMGKGLGVIVNETERLTGMVEELLDFSRIQNGRMVLVMDKTDLLAELEEAVYMLRERAASEKKHFVYDEPENISPVLGDKNRLRQVFINIIDNALKYTPEGGVIGIQVTEENDMIHVVISDTGCGIAKKDLPRIKDQFYKANQKVRGSGIGLAVADEIMTLHKGKLEIESTEDVGTTVTISIPVLDRDDEEILKS